MLALLAEYESNIDQRQKELQVLRAQKEEIKQVESMLANLQVTIYIYIYHVIVM